MPTEFTVKVIQLIAKIPQGKVATYGQIAELAGKPGAARGVSWILHSSSTTHQLPWQRVLGAKGRIAFPKRASSYKEQRRRLELENVKFDDDGTVNLNKFGWKKKPSRVNRADRAIRREK